MEGRVRGSKPPSAPERDAEAMVCATPLMTVPRRPGLGCVQSAERSARAEPQTNPPAPDTPLAADMSSSSTATKSGRAAAKYASRTSSAPRRPEVRRAEKRVGKGLPPPPSPPPPPPPPPPPSPARTAAVRKAKRRHASRARARLRRAAADGKRAGPSDASHRSAGSTGGADANCGVVCRSGSGEGGGAGEDEEAPPPTPPSTHPVAPGCCRPSPQTPPGGGTARWRRKWAASGRSNGAGPRECGK